jgi:hypothetical protein
MVLLREDVEDMMQWELLQVRFANRQAPCLNMFTTTKHTD